jgi:hypothetical protein
MTIRRYKDGDVTVTISGDLERFVVDAARKAGAAALDVMEAEAEDVARMASADWYNHVQRETGKSGDIQVITTITPEQVKVSVGSTDDSTVNYVGYDKALLRINTARQALGEPTLNKRDLPKMRGKETRRVAFIHEAAATSTILEKVDAETYWATPEIMRGPARGLFITGSAEEGWERVWRDLAHDATDPSRRRYYIRVPNPRAMEGRNLVRLLINEPTKRMIIKMKKEMISEIARRINA